MSLLHPFAPERLTSITVRELERHGLDRIPGVALLTFQGRVHCCAECASDDAHLSSLLDGRAENERADVIYGDCPSLAALCCTGHRGRHPQH